MSARPTAPLVLRYEQVSDLGPFAWSELAYAFEQRYIDRVTLGRLVDDKVAAVSDRPTLALLSVLWCALGLPDEARMRDEIRSSLASFVALERFSHDESALERKWLVGYLREILRRYDDPESILQAIDVLYAALGYPASLNQFTTYRNDPGIPVTDTSSIVTFDAKLARRVASARVASVRRYLSRFGS